jgi:hypothetical protein
MMRSARLAAATAAFLLLAPAAPAAARAYDVHIYRVTALNLEYRVQTKVDGQPRVDEGTALDGTAVWRTTFRGPVGRFGFVRISRNAAFLRIARDGNLAARANATATLQGNWTETTIRSGDAGPVTETNSGTCTGQASRPVELRGEFRRRRGGAYAFSIALPRNPPEPGGQCPVTQRGNYPNFFPAGGTILPGAGSRTLRLNYRRSRRYNEDGAVVDETATFTGTVAMARVKLCPFRRGGNQYGCAGFNPDSLG